WMPIRIVVPVTPVSAAARGSSGAGAARRRPRASIAPPAAATLAERRVMMRSSLVHQFSRWRPADGPEGHADQQAGGDGDKQASAGPEARPNDTRRSITPIWVVGFVTKA